MRRRNTTARLTYWFGSAVTVMALGWLVEELKKRQKLIDIDEEKHRQLKAIRTAKHNTIKRLRKGELDKSSINGVIDEFKFQEIVARYED